jgi:protein-disulfide isomerase
LPQIERDYIATGKIRYYFLDFPLESIHPQAFRAAEAANCAGEQGRFWEMHARLFANQAALGPEQLVAHAQALSLDLSRFQSCLESGKYGDKVRSDLRDGQRLGVSGTPMFLLGYVEGDGRRVKGMRWIRGAQPFAAFREALEALLASDK